MNTDFQNILKQLGKQAKKEAAEKQEAEKNKQKQEQDLDFSQVVGQVSPLKNRQQYYAPPENCLIGEFFRSQVKVWRLCAGSCGGAIYSAFL